MNRVVATAQVVNAMGVHARPASAIVNAANQFEAEVELRKGGVVVNAKSIMGVLMLAAEKGSTLEIAAAGADAGGAVEVLVALIESGFPGLDQG
jgi:phosphocarrier protein